MVGMDYHKVLGVAPNASLDDIKKAYHKLAFQYHPDRNVGNVNASRIFREINEAYTALRQGSAEDWHNVLGVQRNASVSEVYSAYYKHKLVLDVAIKKGDKEAQAKLSKITEAYYALGGAEADKQERPPDEW
jgi:DnaJ-class molecular chaperone